MVKLIYTPPVPRYDIAGPLKDMDPRTTILLEGASPYSVKSVASRLSVTLGRRYRTAKYSKNGRKGVQVFRDA